jgi:ATP-dependent DNA helicase RecG
MEKNTTQNIRIVARDYRNRRIGDLLKELRLTEGRGTGFPTIRNAMKDNGSPEPIFETDDQSTYFLTLLLANEERNSFKNSVPFANLEELSSFLNELSNQASNQAQVNSGKDLDVFSLWSNQASNQAIQIIEKELHDKALAILNILSEPKKRAEILESLGLSNQTKNSEKYLDPLVKLGWIELTIPEKPTHQNQKYKLTKEGEILYKLIT